MNSTPVLVLGGTGKTGRRIADRLRAAGHAVRLGSRRADPPFEWTDRSTWAAALDGVGAVYVSYVPDLAFPGADDDVGAFATAARRAGVGPLVLLSGRGEEGALAAEQAVAGTGVEWTVVRSSFFAQNFSEGLMLDAVLAGEVMLPAGDVAEPFIDVDDVADVAFAALTQPGHAGAVHEVTGPRLLTFAEAVAELAAATGRDVRYVPVSPSAFQGDLEAAGLPVDEAAGLTELFATVLDGRNASTTDTVERVLGRPAGDFRAYAQRAEATGVWHVRAAS